MREASVVGRDTFECIDVFFPPEVMTESVAMSKREMEKNLQNAVANVELEGLFCTETEKDEIRKLIQGEISIENYTHGILSDYR